MRRPAFIAKQSSCPSGIPGRLLAWIMSFETEWENEMTLRFAELNSEDRVLEIGFGHGKTIHKAASEVPGGFVAGIDTSPLMVKIAEDRNRDFIQMGRVRLSQGDSSKIPYPDSSFDRCYSVHTLYFWQNPIELLTEIHRVLKPGGRLVLGFRYDDHVQQAFPSSVYRFYSPDEALGLLQRSGFMTSRIESRTHSSRALFWAIAEK